MNKFTFLVTLFFLLQLFTTSFSLANSTKPFIKTKSRPSLRQTDGSWCPTFISKDIPEGETVNTTILNPYYRYTSRIQVTNRVSAGHKAHPNIVSSLAFLKVPGGGCTGTIVSARVIITASHCLRDVTSNSNITVYIGGTTSTPPDGIEKKVSSYTAHPNFTDSFNPSRLSYAYDIAFVTLSSKIPSNQFIAMKVNMNSSIPNANKAGRIAGYGINYYENGEATQMDLPIQSNRTCENDVYNNYSISNEICTSFSSYGIYDDGLCRPCGADGGGPLFQYDDKNNLVLLGVMSFDYECYGTTRYVRISSFLNFLPLNRMTLSSRTDQVNLTFVPCDEYASCTNDSHESSSHGHCDEETCKTNYFYMPSHWKTATIALSVGAGILLIIVLTLIAVVITMWSELKKSRRQNAQAPSAASVAVPAAVGVANSGGSNVQTQDNGPILNA